MEKRYLVKLHNRAHAGYRRAQCVLSKGENELEVTDAQRAQLASDSRITILSVSDIQPETSDPCDGESGVVEPELVSGGVIAEGVTVETTAEPAEGVCIDSMGLAPIPSYYAPVIDTTSKQPEPKCKPNRKTA